MKFERAALIIGMLASAAGSQSQTPNVRQSAIKSCDQVVSTRPGVGLKYKGVVANSDYDFTARVPARLKGWGGVADSAPFHGFTIFLDSKAKSCIIFEIHIRVDEDDIAIHPPRAKALMLGKAAGWQTSHKGVGDGIMLTNVSTKFSFHQPNQIDDGEILLVAPTSNEHDSMSVYDSFLRSLVFGH